MEGSALDQQCGKIAAAFVQRRLNDSTDSLLVRIGLEVQQVCFQENLVQKFGYPDSFLGGDLLALVLSAPFLNEDVHLAELFTDLVRHSSRFVYLVDGKNHRNSGSLGVVDGLNCLRHHGVICCNYYDGKVCHLGSTGTHCGKGFVTRSIQEGNSSSVRELDIVGSYVLGNSSGLSGNHVGLADVVKE